MMVPHLAGRPLPAFPCRADKRPATPHGWKDATDDPARFEDLLMDALGMASLIGVPSGAVSGVDVLDIDPAGLGWLAENEHRLPTTRRHQTRRGVHILFRHCPGLRCSAGKVAPGCDVRADGGYIIWHPTTGLPVSNPDELAPWPGWLLTMAQSGEARGDTNASIHISDDVAAMRRSLSLYPKTAADGSKEAGYAYVALRNAFGELASKRPPGRGTLLERTAFKLGGLVGWIDPEDVCCLLMVACEENRLVRDDGRWLVERAVLRSLLNGVARPRHPTLT